MRKKFP